MEESNVGLNLRSIFSSDVFNDENYNRPRWIGKQSSYTTLRKVTNIPVSVLSCEYNNGDGSSDLTATTASASDIQTKNYYDIIWHDALTGESSTLVSYIRLFAPGNNNEPIIVDDYVISSDRSKVLIFTDAQKVSKKYIYVKSFSFVTS